MHAHSKHCITSQDHWLSCDFHVTGQLDMNDLQSKLHTEEEKLKTLLESRPRSPPETTQHEGTEEREQEGMEQDGGDMEQRQEEGMEQDGADMEQRQEEGMEQDGAESSKVPADNGGSGDSNDQSTGKKDSNESSEHAALVAKQMVVVQYLRVSVGYSI